MNETHGKYHFWSPCKAHRRRRGPEFLKGSPAEVVSIQPRSVPLSCGDLHVDCSASTTRDTRLSPRAETPFFSVRISLPNYKTVLPFPHWNLGRSEEHTSELQSLRHLV